MKITVANTNLYGTFSVIESKRVFNSIEEARQYVKTAPRRRSGEEYFFAYDENFNFIQAVFNK